MKRVILILSACFVMLLPYKSVSGSEDQHHHEEEQGHHDEGSNDPHVPSGKLPITRELEAGFGNIINQYIQIKDSVNKNNLDEVTVDAKDFAKKINTLKSRAKEVETKGIKSGHGHNETTHELHTILQKMNKHVAKIILKTKSKKIDVEEIKNHLASMRDIVSKYIKLFGKPYNVETGKI